MKLVEFDREYDSIHSKYNIEDLDNRIDIFRYVLLKVQVKTHHEFLSNFFGSVSSRREVEISLIVILKVQLG